MRQVHLMKVCKYWRLPPVILVNRVAHIVPLSLPIVLHKLNTRTKNKLQFFA